MNEIAQINNVRIIINNNIADLHYIIINKINIMVNIHCYLNPNQLFRTFTYNPEQIASMQLINDLNAYDPIHNVTFEFNDLISILNFFKVINPITPLDMEYFNVALVEDNIIQNIQNNINLLEIIINSDDNDSNDSNDSSSLDDDYNLNNIY